MSIIDKISSCLSRYADKPNYRGDSLALVAGGSLPLAFAPFSFFPLAIISIAILFKLWQAVSIRRAMWRGFLYGIGLFGVGVSWINTSFYQFGHIPLPGAILLTAAFVMGMALYPALLGGFIRRFFPQPDGLNLLLVWPAAWTLMEWIRGWLLTGFPWLALGYSQIDAPLQGFAPLFGVYGVSSLTAISAGSLVLALQSRRLAVYIIALWIGLWGSGLLLFRFPWTQPIDKPLTVALLQGNVPQEFKWLADYRWPSMQRYLQLSQSQRDVDLIVWPETAIPVFYHEIDTDFLRQLDNEHRNYTTDFLIGLPVMNVDQRYFNSVWSLSPQPDFYYKRHLVPFGEYIPLQAYLGTLLQLLAVPMSEFSAGHAQTALLHAAGQPMGVSICYEDAFGELIRTSLPQATLLVNISNDAWFGEAMAPHQHLEIARMRALESGRYLLRATNTGISAVIDQKGRLVNQAPQFEINILQAQAQPYTGTTLYARLGNGLIIIILTSCVVGAFMYRFRVRA